MLTRIVHQSPALVTFCESLELPLTEPQKRHLINLADGILVTEGKKTLANIQHQFIEAPDPSNIADFLRISPWPTEDVRQRLQRFMVKRPWKSPRPKVTPRSSRSPWMILSRKRTFDIRAEALLTPIVANSNCPP